MNTEIKAFLNKISELAGGFEVTKEMIEQTKSFLEKKDKKEDKKGKKEKKDPNAPKKPTNAYMIYAKDMRPKITGISDAKDIIKEIARRWNEEKQNDSDVYKEYTQKLIDAKEKYTSDMEDYVPSSDDEKDENTPKKKEKKEKKDPNAPKKPTNAYMIYAKDMRSKINDISDAKDLVREIARRWNEEKKNDSGVYKEYTQKFIDAKEKYASDMEDYSSSSDEAKVEKKIEFESPKKTVKKVEVDEDEVPEPPKKKTVKKVEVDEDEVPEPPKKKTVKKVEADEDEVPEPPKKKTVKKNTK